MKRKTCESLLYRIATEHEACRLEGRPSPDGLYAISRLKAELSRQFREEFNGLNACRADKYEEIGRLYCDFVGAKSKLNGMACWMQSETSREPSERHVDLNELIVGIQTI